MRSPFSTNYQAESFPAKILSGSWAGSGYLPYYSWTEVFLEPVQGWWSGQVSPRFGVNNARELNGINMLSGTPFYARLFLEGSVSGQLFYVFQGASGASSSGTVSSSGSCLCCTSGSASGSFICISGLGEPVPSSQSGWQVISGAPSLPGPIVPPNGSGWVNVSGFYLPPGVLPPYSSGGTSYSPGPGVPPIFRPPGLPDWTMPVDLVPGQGNFPWPFPIAFPPAMSGWTGLPPALNPGLSGTLPFPALVPPAFSGWSFPILPPGFPALPFPILPGLGLGGNPGGGGMPFPGLGGGVGPGMQPIAGGPGIGPGLGGGQGGGPGLGILPLLPPWFPPGLALIPPGLSGAIWISGAGIYPANMSGAIAISGGGGLAVPPSMSGAIAISGLGIVPAGSSGQVSAISGFLSLPPSGSLMISGYSLPMPASYSGFVMVSGSLAPLLSGTTAGGGGGVTNTLTRYSGATTLSGVVVATFSNPNGLHGSFRLINTDLSNSISYHVNYTDVFGNLTSGVGTVGGSGTMQVFFDAANTAGAAGQPPYKTVVINAAGLATYIAAASILG